jgi:hypothetical protein
MRSSRAGTWSLQIGEPQVVREVRERMAHLERRTAHEGAGFTGKGNQRTGLEALHARDLANVLERGLATNINHLATDHAGETHRLRETQDEIGADMRIGMCFV